MPLTSMITVATEFLVGTGGGFASRMTSGYAHVGWETLVRAVEVLEQPVSSIESNFGLDSGKIPADSQETRKAG